MPAVGKSDLEREDGFVRAYDARAAKRQFQISVAIVFVLAFAAIVLGILTQLNRPAVAGRIGRANAEHLLPSGDSASVLGYSLRQKPRARQVAESAASGASFSASSGWG